MSEPTTRALSPAEQSLFADFFSALRADSIPYVLLRNYEGFPKQIGHDLDLFVPRRKLRNAENIFRGLLSRAGGRVIIVHERDYFLDVRFTLDSRPSDAIHLDLYHGSFTWHGLPYLSEESLLAGAQEHDGWPVPRPAHEALNIFFTSILWGGFYKARYQARIAELLAISSEKEEFLACVKHAFGDGGLPLFDPCSPDLPDKALVSNYAVGLRRQFKHRQFSRAPFRSGFLMFRYWGTELLCVLKPKGLAVAIVGPDSRLNSLLMERLSACIGDLFGERSVHNETEGRANLISAWVRHWVNWPRLFLKPKAQVHLVLCGSAPCDWWCKAERFGFEKYPSALLKLAAVTVPGADFTFALIPGRAVPYHPVPDCYVRWVGGDVCRFAMDSTLPAPEILDSMEQILVNYLSNRELTR